MLTHQHFPMNGTYSDKRHSPVAFPIHVAFALAAPLRKASFQCPSTIQVKCRRLPQCVVVLGGSSGVGLEASNYLKSQGVTVTSFSRRTGHDLTDPQVSKSVLHLARGGLAISVGAGRRRSSREDELALYQSIVKALHTATEVSLVVAVARNLILAEVHKMFAAVQFPWVLLRPGPLVDDDPRKPEILQNEKLLVTPDLRCNGLVSRRGVGTVIGDLLLGRVPTDNVKGQVLGVYDRNRMINLPSDAPVVGSHKWGLQEN